jgi:hypothetical protein
MAHPTRRAPRLPRAPPPVGQDQGLVGRAEHVAPPRGWEHSASTAPRPTAPSSPSSDVARAASGRITPRDAGCRGRGIVQHLPPADPPRPGCPASFRGGRPITQTSFGHFTCVSGPGRGRCFDRRACAIQQPDCPCAAWYGAGVVPAPAGDAHTRPSRPPPRRLRVGQHQQPSSARVRPSSAPGWWTLPGRTLPHASGPAAVRLTGPRREPAVESGSTRG